MRYKTPWNTDRETETEVKMRVKAFSSFKVQSDVKERLDSFYEESKDQALE